MNYRTLKTGLTLSVILTLTLFSGKSANGQNPEPPLSKDELVAIYTKLAQYDVLKSKIVSLQAKHITQADTIKAQRDSLSRKNVIISNLLADLKTETELREDIQKEFDNLDGQMNALKWGAGVVITLALAGIAYLLFFRRK